MKIIEQDVVYVAGLANIELTAAERQTLVRDLGSILEYIGHLNELDTTNVSPMTQVTVQAGSAGPEDGTSFKYAQREDVLRPSLPHDEAMRNAPATDGEFFKVPKVIEK